MNRWNLTLLIVLTMCASVVRAQTSIEALPAENIEVLGKLDILCNTFQVEGGYAYAGRSKFFQVFDMADPLKPKPLKEVELAYGATGIALSGSKAYAAMGEVGVQEVDISNRAAPKSLEFGFCQAVDLAVGGSTWYASYGSYGLNIVNMSDPLKPVTIGHYIPPKESSGIAVVGSKAYLAVGDSGIQILDISDPAKPSLIGEYDTAGSARDVAVEGSLACVADGKAGVLVLNIADPAQPILLGSIKLTGASWSVSMNKGLIYVSNYYDGLFVIRYTGQ